jgi:hypothetical protein
MEIGQQVKWSTNSVGKIECVGVYLQQIDNQISEVICHYMNEKKCILKIQIETIKLQAI